jgi:hypothetical protein
MESLNRSNEYSVGIRRLPEEKLREYVEKPEDYHDEAVLAAIWELSNRRKQTRDEKKLEAEINGRLNQPAPELAHFTSGELKIADAPLPSLYSIRSIQLFSVLFSVLAGGILMAINFNRTTQKAEALKVLGFSLIFTLFSFLVFSIIGSQSPVLSIVLNLLGAFLIDQYFWKRVFGEEFKFNKQQIWSALLIALILISPLIWYAIKIGAVQPI